MGPDMVIAMVLAAGVTHAWQTGTRRCQAAWTDARRRAEERGATRERARQHRVRARRSRFATARSTGPRDPLWWIYAAGWLIAATASATGAGLVGLYTGARAGSRAGYRIGREGARKGHSYRQSWQQWRRERDWLDTEQCQRCGGYTLPSQLTRVDGLGRVCPDCVPGPSNEPSSTPDEDEPSGRAESDDRSQHSRERTRQWASGQNLRCIECGGTAEPDWLLCVLCARLRYEQRRKEQHEHSEREAPRTTMASGQDTSKPGRIYVDAERVDVQEDTDKEESPPMSELMPANAGQVAGTGEGYTDTITTLAALSTLLGQAHEEVQNLGDMLTANSLDADTLGQINDLADHLDAAAPLAQNLHKHVESRHAPVADAVARAGGSSNVAHTPWYDQY